MKSLIAALFLMTSHSAFATPPPPPEFKKLAVSSVQSLYGRPGDKVVVDLKDISRKSNLSVETYEVVLSNGPSVGSAIYSVVVSKRESAQPGEEVASVKVTYVNGN